MSFKLNGAPYNKDDMNIAVYRRDLKDGSAGKSNHTGIIVDKDVDANMEKAVVAHETVHQHQQRDGELDYDKNNFYWKGKTYSRENLNEHNEDLPWEKEAYKASNGILNGKNKDMRNKFELKGYRGNNKAFKALSDRKLIGIQDGASAEMCGPGGGDECDAFSKKTKKPKFKDKSKQKRSRGTLEVENHTTMMKDPAMEVSVGQMDSQGRDTGWRSSDGKSVSDFKKEVKRTNIFSGDIGERASEYISRPEYQRTEKETIKTRKNNRGKAKVKVKRAYDYEDGKRTTQTTPYDMTVTKKRAIGGSKTKKYTTEASRAQDNKALFKAGKIGGKNKRSVVDVKLVSEDKMRKLSKKANKKLGKGNPKTSKVKNFTQKGIRDKAIA